MGCGSHEQGEKAESGNPDISVSNQGMGRKIFVLLSLVKSSWRLKDVMVVCELGSRLRGYKFHGSVDGKN